MWDVLTGRVAHETPGDTRGLAMRRGNTGGKGKLLTEVVVFY